ncbi:MAG: class I SAM-dependent methyltransferase, partial [Bdellovibrionales bacterium]|nr:class I SAM-dependent methyltransferase [Bdellovibrionales bacterium]
GIWQVICSEDHEMYYPDSGNEDCYAIEDQSYWFRHRNRVILKIFSRIYRGKSIWEIGAGNGFVAKALNDIGYEVVAVEPGNTGAKYARTRGVEKSICGFFESLQLPDRSVEAIGCFDVVEHLPNPGQLLTEFHRTLKPGGIVVVTVPAFAWLWSQMDDFAGHKQRYTIQELHKSFAMYGFEVRAGSYFIVPLVLPLYFARTRPYQKGVRMEERELISRGKQQITAKGASISLRLLEIMLAAELPAIGNVFLPLGTSIIAAYERK